MPTEFADVTDLLVAWSDGDPNAAETLMPLVYGELRQMASRYLRDERRDHTLQPTEIVNEAFIRLLGQRAVDWKNRAHFFAIAARMMRRVLLDHARRHRADKRGAQMTRVALDEEVGAPYERPVAILALDDALAGLAALDPFKAKMVELRFFGGLSIAETAHVLGCSTDTVTRHWRSARAWLARELTEAAGDDS